MDHSLLTAILEPKQAPSDKFLIDDEVSIRRVQYTIFAIAGLIFETGFGAANLFQGEYLVAAIAFISATALVVGIPVSRRLQDPRIVYRTNMALAALAFMTFISVGGENGSKSLWMLLFPFIYCFVLDYIEGSAWSIVVYALTMILMITSPSALVHYNYHGAFLHRYATVFLMSGVVAGWHEMRRHRQHVMLLDANAKLIEDQAFLRESESRYRLLFSHMTSAFALYEAAPGGPRMLESNALFKSLFMRGRITATAGKTGAQPELDAWLNEAMARVISSGSPEEFERRSNLYNKELEVSIYRPAEGRVALVCTDASERKRTEEERLRAQRMSSIGTLAGGIAHDFNNILTGVIGNLSLLHNTAQAARGESAQLLSETLDAAGRAHELAKRLLTFAKGGAPVKRSIDPAAVVREAASFVTRGSAVRCETDLPADLWPVMGDPYQLAQVMHNLLLNAIQAMSSGGIIRVKGANLTLPACRCVELRVIDTGVGIPDENLARIFDPYFSTKAEGRGLGLAMVHSIVHGHGGSITVSSEPGKGSVFHIRLPVSDRPVELPHEQAPACVARGTGRVLLMDDDDTVRKACARMLSALGYEYELVSEGRAAIDVYRKAAEAGRPFTMVIMDLTIPGGMGGKESVVELKKTFPDAKVVVSSGYSDDPVISEFRDYGFDAVLAKPYRYEELAKTLSGLSRTQKPG